MKVIVAGMSKTGTKSMNAALTKLGFKVYDAPENMFLLSEEYNKIVFEGWTIDDFRKMYENVDAVVDFPAFCFWYEIHKAFPGAKIAGFTVRYSVDCEKVSSGVTQWEMTKNQAETTEKQNEPV